MQEPAFSLPEMPSKPAAPEGPARPKVMRRPAQFARVAQQAEILPIAPARLELLAPNTAPLPTARAWQEDGRFGAVLLALLVLLNVVAAVAFTQPKVTTEALKLSPVAATTDTQQPSVNILDDKATDQ